MRIDKARHYDATSGVDDLAIVINQTFNLSTPANRFDLLAPHQDRAVFNNRQLTQVTANARPFGAGERYQL
jgi:hypothetical protein